MHDLWILTRLILILAGLFCLPLVLLFRAMARQVREDYRLGHRARTKSYENLAIRFAYLSAGIVLYVGLVSQEWLVSLAFGGFTLGISMTIWLNKPKSSQS
jgi:hypothetical protein